MTKEFLHKSTNLPINLFYRTVKLSGLRRLWRAGYINRTGEIRYVSRILIVKHLVKRKFGERRGKSR